MSLIFIEGGVGDKTKGTKMTTILILGISMTPFAFTFKIMDWGWKKWGEKSGNWKNIYHFRQRSLWTGVSFMLVFFASGLLFAFLFGGYQTHQKKIDIGGSFEAAITQGRVVLYEILPGEERSRVRLDIKGDEDKYYEYYYYEVVVVNGCTIPSTYRLFGHTGVAKAIVTALQEDGDTLYLEVEQHRYREGEKTYLDKVCP